MAPRFCLRRPGLHLLFLGCSLVLLAGTLSAAPAIEITADRQFDFAGHLFAGAAYERAVTEYERFIFLFPEDGRVDEARYQIGMALFHAQQYSDAAEAFLEVIDRSGGRPIAETDTSARAYFRLSDCYVRMGAPGQAVNNLNNLAAVAASPQLQDEARYRAGWILLEAGAWQPAATAFNAIRPERREDYRLPELFSAMAGIRDLPRKQPAVAGALAVVPGMGYLYCERYRDALVALVLNGGMIAATYTAFDNDNPALGGILALVGAGFYTGSIYGSISSAQKYNRDQTEQFISGLRQRYRLDLSLSPVPGGAALSLHGSF